MKKLKLIPILLSAIFFSACNYLDIVPDNTATIEYAFRNRVEAEKFLYTCYSYLPNGVNMGANPALGASAEIWEEPYELSRKYYAMMIYGNTKTSPYFNYWDGETGGRKLFEAIRSCNMFLENVDLVKDADSYELERWRAEAKFLKAYYHWYLAQLYGPIPLIKENLPISASKDQMQVYRDPFDDVVDYIVGLIDEAKDALPAKIDNEIAEMGRITSAAAYALKAKILVTAASPLFNGNTDFSNFKDSRGILLMNPQYSQQKWVRARQACEEAINFCDASLGGPGGRSLYTVNDYLAPSAMTARTRLLVALNKVMTERWNKELIWGDSRNDISSYVKYKAITINQTFFRTAGTVSAHNPTLRTVEKYYTQNGIPIEEDKTWNYTDRYKFSTVPADQIGYAIVGEQTANLHLYREPRFYSNIGFDRGLYYIKGPVGLDDNENLQYKIRCRNEEDAGRNGTMTYSGTGFFDKKTVPVECSVTSAGAWTGYRYPYPLIRLADLYLLYAEAINESLDNDNSPSSDLAIEYVDKIRARAGLKGVKESWQNYAHDQYKFKYETKAGMREIIRRERLIELAFESQDYFDLRRWKLMTTVMNTPIQGWNVNGYEADSYYNVITLYKPQYSSKDYFYPIKESSMLTNPNLTQNPGW